MIGNNNRPQDLEDANPIQELAAGYPRLAGYIERIPEVGIFRSFGAMNARRLLYLQAELTGLQNQLQKIENTDKNSSDKSIQSYSVDWYWLKESMSSENAAAKQQWELVQNILPKLNEYNEALIQQKTIASMKPPNKYELKQLHRCLEAIGLSLIGEDSDVWGNALEPDKRAPDLVCLRPREQEDVFSTWVAEKATSIILSCCDRRIKRSRMTGLKGIKDKTVLRITYFINSIIASILPSASIIILYCIRSTWARLGMLVVFNFLVTVCLQAFTKASRSDVFAVSAAFAAVLVVFIGTSA